MKIIQVKYLKARQMEFTEKEILNKTHYGLNIFAHVLKQYYTEETVLSLSGKKCKPAKNPFKENSLTLEIMLQEDRFVFHDSNDPSFKGNPFNFAALYYRLSGQEL